MKPSFVAGFGPSAGHRVLRAATLEPWGQTTSRVLSPEGLLIGITYTPWMHEGSASTDSA